MLDFKSVKIKKTLRTFDNLLRDFTLADCVVTRKSIMFANDRLSLRRDLTATCNIKCSFRMKYKILFVSGCADLQLVEK